MPAMAISPWVPDRAVVTAQYRHTSMLTTLRRRWSLGDPLTARDAVAADIAPLLTLDSPRDPASWPEVAARPVPPFDPRTPPAGVAMRGLAKAALLATLALCRHRGKDAPELTKEDDIEHADGVALVGTVLGDAFPRLHGG